MLGNNISTANWPACGEIDIMEHRAFELNKIFGTVHYQGQSNPAAGEGSTVVISNAAIDFHRYAIQWSATSIKFMVDDVVFYTFSNTSSTPFNQSFFMIVNLAMGGNFGGTVDPAFVSDQMEIDYVRVYQ
jgi:beta-glucanase (GH16 family)